MAASPSWTPGPGLRAREQVPRTQGFSVWWSEGGEGLEDEHLPEVGPSAPPPPSESVGGATQCFRSDSVQQGQRFLLVVSPL